MEGRCQPGGARMGRERARPGPRRRPPRRGAGRVRRSPRPALLRRPPTFRRGERAPPGPTKSRGGAAAARAGPATAGAPAAGALLTPTAWSHLAAAPAHLPPGRPAPQPSPTGVQGGPGTAAPHEANGRGVSEELGSRRGVGAWGGGACEAL